MFTITCSLTFKNGKTVTAKVTTPSPVDQKPVVYSGATDELPRRFDTATPALLKVLFRNIAKETGAEFSKVEEGEYDEWPE